MTISDEWWDRWWEQDYSWQGLAQKPWEGWYVDTAWVEGEAFEPVPEDERVEGVVYREATLQDYWRRAMLEAGLDEESFLISQWFDSRDPQNPENFGEAPRCFSVVHLPQNWRNGEETLKSNPQYVPEALSDVLRAEIGREIQETFFVSDTLPPGPDHRMQWQGVVLPSFDLKGLAGSSQTRNDRIPISLLAQNAAFYGLAQFQSAAFWSNANFKSAAFFDTSLFNNSTFSGDAHFDDAIFFSQAHFPKSTFLRGASFNRANFWKASNFNNVGFFGTVDFRSAVFSGLIASFRGVVFSEDTIFVEAGFSDTVDFRNSVFLSDVAFSGQGNSVDTDPVEAKLSFNLANGTATGTYDQPKQGGWIARRSFPKARFDSAVFFGRVRFDNRDFNSKSSFAGAIFMREAAFHSSELHRGVHFRDTDFKFALNRAWPPTHVRRESRGGRWVLFKHWVKDSLFVNSRPVVRQTQHVRSFLKARRRLFEAAKRMTEMRGEATPRWREWKVTFSKMLKKREDEFAASPKDQQNAYYAEVEDCLRTLKHKMEDRRDRGQEARFFRMELLARRQRQRDPHVPWWEEGFSYLYQGTSDFGTSFMQPLSVLFLFVIPVFSLLYLFMGTAPTHLPTVNEWGDAIGYSFGRVLPFGPWDDPKACSMTGRMLAEVVQPDCPAVAGTEGLYYRGGTPFWLRFWGSVQSLLALILVFLSGLAIRRRFQIN